VAFLATAVLLISLGAVGLQVLSGVNRRAQDLVKSQERIGAYRQFQHDTSLPASWSWNERTLEATLQQLNQFRYELDQLQVIAMDDADLLSRVRESYEQFLQAVGQVVELINARKAVDERKLHVKQASLLADRLERQTNELVNKAEANLMASIDSSQAAYTRSRWVVIGFALASIAMALVLGYAISWSLIGPVRLMDSRLRIVGSGDFSERVEVPNRDELGALAGEFNRMATQLQDSYTKLTHSVEELTALGEIGQAVSSSLDLETVLNSIIARAVELSAARGGLIYEYDEAKQQFHLIRGSHRLDKELEEVFRATPIHLGEGVAGQAAFLRIPVQVPDVRDEGRYDVSRIKVVFERRGYRSLLAVPLLLEQRIVGVFVVWRQEPGNFAQEVVNLLQTFATQSVIAIQNARLFREIDEKSRTLEELSRNQDQLYRLSTALQEPLSLADQLTRVLDAARQVVGLDRLYIWTLSRAADSLMVSAQAGFAERDWQGLLGVTIPLDEAGALTAVWRDGEPMLFTDANPLPEKYRLQPPYSALAGLRVKSFLVVPMIARGRTVGVLAADNRVSRAPIATHTMDLLQTFAAQAAVAVENARLFQEIQEKSRELAVASQHKSEFLANMSHELRTPLNAIIGFSEVLTERMFGELNEKQDEYLKDIYASGQHLLSLINDILDLSKIEAGRMELELADFDLPNAIDNALTLMRERAGRRGITLGREIDARVGTIRADERKVKQVMLNLLSNAIKFTPEGGRIDVRAAMNRDTVEVSVTDTGTGIAPEDQAAIFEEFRQVGTADKKVEGTGLGLALSRKFIELHGGRVWVKSQVGAGSTFTFTIPVRREPGDRGGAHSLNL